MIHLLLGVRYVIVSFGSTMLDVMTSESMLILRNIRAELKKIKSAATRMVS